MKLEHFDLMYDCPKRSKCKCFQSKTYSTMWCSQIAELRLICCLCRQVRSPRHREPLASRTNKFKSSGRDASLKTASVYCSSPRARQHSNPLFCPHIRREFHYINRLQIRGRHLKSFIFNPDLSSNLIFCGLPVIIIQHCNAVQTTRPARRGCTQQIC